MSTRFCNDCVHFEPVTETCARTIKSSRNIVTGRLEVFLPNMCRKERREIWPHCLFTGECGRIGRFFKRRTFGKLEVKP